MLKIKDFARYRYNPRAITKKKIDSTVHKAAHTCLGFFRRFSIIKFLIEILNHEFRTIILSMAFILSRIFPRITFYKLSIEWKEYTQRIL